MNSVHGSQKIAVKYQLRVVFRHHDFLNVIVKECEKEIQSYLRRVLVQKQSYGNFAGMRVKTLFNQLFFTCFIYVAVFQLCQNFYCAFLIKRQSEPRYPWSMPVYNRAGIIGFCCSTGLFTLDHQYQISKYEKKINSSYIQILSIRRKFYYDNSLSRRKSEMISISDRIRDSKSWLKFVVAATGVLFLLSVKICQIWLAINGNRTVRLVVPVKRRPDTCGWRMRMGKCG